MGNVQKWHRDVQEVLLALGEKDAKIKIRELAQVAKGTRETLMVNSENTNDLIPPQKHPSTATSIFFLCILAGAEPR